MSMHQIDDKSSNEKSEDFLKGKVVEYEEKLKLKDLELESLKETFEIMKNDRKRLKNERVELLNQTKNLYKIIEAKELEIRDFLRHYERKTKETSQAVKRLIDTKGETEKENSDLKNQCIDLLEETNELKLLIESKNVTINKLQKQIFEFKTKSPRYSLGKDSDYGYASSKSRDTLSSSMIETTLTTTPNVKGNKNNTSVNENNTTLKASYLNLSMKSKLNASNLKLKSKKDERSAKCKSNDSFIYVKNQQINESLRKSNQKLKSKLKPNSNQDQQQQLDLLESPTKSLVKSSSKQSLCFNLSNTNIDCNCSDENDDLNKALNSEAFIDLDIEDAEDNSANTNSAPVTHLTSSIRKHIEPNSYTSSSTSFKGSSALSSSSYSSSSKSPLITVTNTISPSSSLTSNSLSSSSSYKNETNNKETSGNRDFSIHSKTNASQLASSQVPTKCDENNQNECLYKSYNKQKLFDPIDDGNDSDNVFNKTLNDFGNLSHYSVKQPLSMSMSIQAFQQPTPRSTNSSILSRSSKLFQSFIRRKHGTTSGNDKSQVTDSNKLYGEQMSASMVNSKSSYSFNEISSEKRSFLTNNSSVFHTTKNKFATLSRNYKPSLSNSDNIYESLQVEIIEKWTSNEIKSWLENIGMNSSHIKSALKQLKSGKQLLANMSDTDLEKIFSIESKYNQMHKRKIRMAIDDLKCLASSVKCKYPKCADITNQWLCNVWLGEIGLINLKDTFKANLIDGRVLSTLQRKDLEKYLGICKRTQQTSLLLAVDLLRQYEFDVKKIESIRKENRLNEINDTHLWVNEDFVEWLKAVNLQSFLKKLNESGLHGALIVDNQFDVEFLYDSLGVSEIEPRYINMKKIIEDEIRLLRKPVEKTNVFVRKSFKNDKKSFNFRGSLGRALGKKTKREIGTPHIDDDTYKRIENSHKIVEMKHTSMYIPHSVV